MSEGGGVTKFPDSGGTLEDRAILRNAVLFTTTQRAFAGLRILREPLEHLDDLYRACLAVESFQQFVVSSEDLLGWFFALKEWNPGTPDGSLIAGLDRIQVGRHRWTEAKALELLQAMTAHDYRVMMRIPTSEELQTGGWDSQAIKTIETAMAAQLNGIKRLVVKRSEKDRSRVNAYNKAKHGFLAFPERYKGKQCIAFKWARGGYSDPAGIYLEQHLVLIDPQTIRMLLRDGIGMQAVLNSLLTLVLWTRYDERIESAPWVRQAFLMLPAAANAVANS